MSAANVTPGAYSEQFARYVRETCFEDLPAPLVSLIKDCIVDQIGAQLIGSTLPWTRLVYDYSRSIAGPGSCTVVGTNDRFSAPEAAFVNATFGHACELDDVGHAGVAVIPAALALAEQENISGRELLTTVGLGYEVFFRLFNAMMPQILERGFAQQVVLGVFASTSVAGRLLRVSQEQLVHAYGIAGSHASGTAEYDQSGGEVKRVHAGLGARGGVQAVMLARLGLTGPTTIMEGKRGIFHTFVDHAREEDLVESLRKKYIFEKKSAFKMYPACASIHTGLEALGILIQKHNIKAQDVRQIRVGIKEYALMHGAAIIEPTGVLSAQFSLAYSFALRLIMGRTDLDLYMNEKLYTDANIVQLCRKVVAYADPNARDDRHAGSLVTVELNSGTVFEHYCPYRKGTRENPATKTELKEKFIALGSSVLERERLEEAAHIIDGLEHAQSVRPLMALLSTSGKSANAA